jgi:hypothetical protein
VKPIAHCEREKMLAARPCGPRVIARLEAIDVTKLPDLADRGPYRLVHEVNIPPEVLSSNSLSLQSSSVRKAAMRRRASNGGLG